MMTQENSEIIENLVRIPNIRRYGSNPLPTNFLDYHRGKGDKNKEKTPCY